MPKPRNPCCNEDRSLPRRDEPNSRTCIVTRRAASPDALIRFVAAPDGTVVPDLRRRLPGRGVWVTADAAHVRAAEARKLFAHGLGEPVRVEPGLADRVGDLLAAAALGALSLARKAGSATAGFAKVQAALKDEAVVALIHSADATADGMRKLRMAARRRFGEHELPVIRCFTGEQLDLAFGRPNVIHAALLAGPASSNVLTRVDALIRYSGGNGDEADDVRPQLKTSAVPAEP
jgi:predicted RNA-binding protein YlxR (DUF448 family)